MRERLPRPLHAGAWWLWASGLAVAAAQTNHPLVLALVIGVASLVVAARRPGSEWAGGYRAYLMVALVVIVVRMTFRVVLGGDYGTTVLVSLPRLPLPEWAGGTALGGPITAEEALAGLYDGLRLAAMVICVGAANTLADPRRLLRSFPRALGDIATAVVVALSLAPQLVETVYRVRRARRLRGETGRGRSGLRALLVPVLEDTLARSMALAASMDSRGYGRTAVAAETRPAPASMAWLGLGATTGAMFWLLAAGTSMAGAVVVGTGGLALTTATLARRGRGSRRTRYRPEPWRATEWLVSVSGLTAAVAVAVAGVVTPAAIVAVLEPLSWPAADPVLLAAVSVAALPAWMAPPLTRSDPKAMRPVGTVAS